MTQTDARRTEDLEYVALEDVLEPEARRGPAGEEPRARRRAGVEVRRLGLRILLRHHRARVGRGHQGTGNDRESGGICGVSRLSSLVAADDSSFVVGAPFVAIVVGMPRGPEVQGEERHRRQWRYRYG